MKIINRLTVEDDGKVYKCDFADDDGCGNCVFKSTDDDDGHHYKQCKNMLDASGNSLYTHCMSVVDKERLQAKRGYVYWKFYGYVRSNPKPVVKQSKLDIEILDMIF